MIEVIKPIAGYEGKYAVSNFGRVWSLMRGEPFLLKCSVTTNGYNRVSLSNKQHGVKYATVHRLVAEAFLVKREGCYEVNHLDECKTNNHHSNLEWCTAQHNVDYTVAKTYTFINPDGKTVTFTNLMEFCRDNNLDSPAMTAVNEGRRSSHKGWRLHANS